MKIQVRKEKSENVLGKKKKQRYVYVAFIPGSTLGSFLSF